MCMRNCLFFGWWSVSVNISGKTLSSSFFFFYWNVLQWYGLYLVISILCLCGRICAQCSNHQELRRNDLQRGRNLVTPLCSPTTYEGLLDDALGIQSGKERNSLAFCFSLSPSVPFSLSLSLSLSLSPSPVPRFSRGLPSTLSLSSSFLSFSFHFPSLILDVVSFSPLIHTQFISLGIVHSRCICWSLYCHFLSVILGFQKVVIELSFLFFFLEGFVEFDKTVTGKDQLVKLLLNSNDKVRCDHICVCVCHTEKVPDEWLCVCVSQWKESAKWQARQVTQAVL